MGCYYERRGVGEIVGAVFAIIAIVALIVVLVYLFNLFNYALASSRNVETELYVVTHSAVSVVNVSCSGEHCSVLLSLSPEAIPYVRDVVCVGEGRLSNLISCRFNIVDVDHLNVTYVKSEFGQYDSVLLSIVLNRGFVMYISMNNKPIVLSALVLPHGGGHRYTSVIVVLYNNATSWTCINATLRLELICYKDGARYVVYSDKPVFKTGVVCLQPLSSVVLENVTKMSPKGNTCLAYVVGSYTVNLVRTYNVNVTAGVLYR